MLSMKKQKTLQVQNSISTNFANRKNPSSELLKIISEMSFNIKKNPSNKKRNYASKPYNLLCN